MTRGAPYYWVAGINKEPIEDGDEKIFMLAWNESDGPQTKENAELFCRGFSKEFPHVRYFVIALYTPLC